CGRRERPGSGGCAASPRSCAAPVEAGPPGGADPAAVGSIQGVNLALEVQPGGRLSGHVDVPGGGLAAVVDQAHTTAEDVLDNRGKARLSVRNGGDVDARPVQEVTHVLLIGWL